ncbi:hypothetical protein OHV05_17210 [Kitasatospora sp. NBC_00070]|uniref:hypothetical protein n=1 Tax=Kitasatospora sp. NBC_00070 TaxID=2975962 RepID=UPI00324CC83E
MNDTITQAPTAADQLRAAQLFVLLVTEHPDLPAPTFNVSSDMVEMTFYDHRLPAPLTAFEQWREALNIDPATVGHGVAEDLGWLRVTTQLADLTLRIIAFHRRDWDPADLGL